MSDSSNFLHAIVCGPVACGKTHNATRFAKFLGCTRIVDDASSLSGVDVTKIEEPTLFLTSDIDFSLPATPRYRFNELLPVIEKHDV